MSELKKTDYLVLVNGENRIPEGYEDTVELITVENAAGNQFKVEKKTYEAYMRLQEDMLKTEGIQTVLLNSYRTIRMQEETFARVLSTHSWEYTCKYVAKPGCSEHHTGLAIDVGVLIDGKVYRTQEELFSIAHLLEIVQKKLPEYGFILRYPAGKEPITQIGYEPWHYRYIDSPELAKEITEKGICLEEYWQKN